MSSVAGLPAARRDRHPRHAGADRSSPSGRSSARSGRRAGRCSSRACSTIGFPLLFAASSRRTGEQMSPGDHATIDALDIGLAGVVRGPARDRHPRRALHHRRVLDRDDPRDLDRRSQARAGALGEGVVFAYVVFMLMLPAVLIAFFATQAILSGTTSSRARSRIPESRDRCSAARRTSRFSGSSPSESARSFATRPAASRPSPGSCS